MLLILFFLFNIQLQDTITVYQSSHENSLIVYEQGMMEILTEKINKKNGATYRLNFVNLENYEILNQKVEMKDDKLCAIGRLKITNQNLRDYDFSHPYLSVKEAIVTLVNQFWYQADWMNKGSRIAAFKESLNHEQSKIFKNTYKSDIILLESSTRSRISNLLLKAKFDFCITEAIDTWNNRNLEHLSEFKEAKLYQYGIMFPKGSVLKKTFDEEIKEFVNSEENYQLLKRIYGQEVMEYCKKLNKSLEIKQQRIANSL
jgi:hypothetical protein